MMTVFKISRNYVYTVVSHGPFQSLLLFYYLLLFSTRPSPGLLPVLGPLGSGTDATHLPSPALQL